MPPSHSTVLLGLNRARPDDLDHRPASMAPAISHLSPPRISGRGVLLLRRGPVRRRWSALWMHRIVTLSVSVRTCDCRALDLDRVHLVKSPIRSSPHQTRTVPETMGDVRGTSGQRGAGVAVLQLSKFPANTPAYRQRPLVGWLGACFDVSHCMETGQRSHDPSAPHSRCAMCFEIVEQPAFPAHRRIALIPVLLKQLGLVASGRYASPETGLVVPSPRSSGGAT